MSISLTQTGGAGSKPLSLRANATPVSIEIRAGKPSITNYSDSSGCPSVCLRCLDQPCISYNINERDSELAKNFRTDPSTNVCAVGAISWSTSKQLPEIDSQTCINCGICAARCPTKAIYLTPNTALVSDAADDHLVECTPENQESTVTTFRNTVCSGTFLEESDQTISAVLCKLRELSGKGKSLNPNLLIRNLLRTLGIPTEAYPQGVQYNTVDIVFRVGKFLGAGEVELSNAAIDNPRNLAAIIAFLASRHNIPKDEIVSTSFVLRLPQGREQYWMVVDDMRNVLEINIHTLTIVALLILVWSRATLNMPNELLHLSQDRESSLRPYLESVIGREIRISEGFENQLEPSKLVE